MSSATSVNSALADYVAGRMTAQQLVGIVAVAYYKGDGRREMLRPVMDVIERAHPGVAELSASNERPGFTVRLAERPFPKQLEPALMRAAANISGTAADSSPVSSPGFLTRLFAAIRKLFRA